jgi:flagellar protein FliO/FliZ
MIDYLLLIIKVVFSLIFILGLIILTFKYGGGKLQLLQNKRYLKILERISLSKENSLLVVKMGAKAFVISSSHSNIQILNEVSEEELINLEKLNETPQNDKVMEFIKKLKKKEE